MFTATHTLSSAFFTTPAVLGRLFPACMLLLARSTTSYPAASARGVTQVPNYHESGLFDSAVRSWHAVLFQIQITALAPLLPTDAPDPSGYA